MWVYLRAHRLEKNTIVALDISLFILFGGLLGARLFHVGYEGHEYYSVRPMDVFKLWQGGFVFYGGLAGAIFSAFLYTRYKGEPFKEWADFFAPVGSLGYALGRFACLLNGCCFGRHCDWPWAIEFQHPGLPSGLRHPTQIYASLWEMGTLFILLWLGRKENHKAGVIFTTWIFLHAIGRLVMEAFRDDFRGQLILNLSISTWISVLLILASAVSFYKLRHSERES